MTGVFSNEIHLEKDEAPFCMKIFFFFSFFAFSPLVPFSRLPFYIVDLIFSSFHPFTFGLSILKSSSYPPIPYVNIPFSPHYY